MPQRSGTLASAMTEEIAPLDAYVKAVDAHVTDVIDEGLVLDRTVFYARGGGQPGDVGVLRGDFGELPITDTFRVKGVPVHQFDGAPPRVGDAVQAAIDWERRYLLMRTHTAVHALTAILWYEFGVKVTGSGMEPGVGRADFPLDSISVEFGEIVEAKVNDALARNHETAIRYLERTVALSDPDLIRTQVNLLPDWLDPIRVVDIVGLDKQADGGTHVRSTGEVGSIRVVKTESKGKSNKRIRIELVR